MTENKLEDSDRNAFFKVKNIPIHFQEDWNQGIGGGLWSTALAMGEYFAKFHPIIQNKLADIQKEKDSIRAIELGSGNGFLSLCFLAAMSYIEDQQNKNILSELAITDMQDHVDLMEKIVYEKNKDLIEENSTVEVTVCEHIWGVFPPQEQKIDHKYDFIFGSDVVYKAYIPFIQSLDYFSTEKTIALIGISMLETSPHFFDLLLENGFIYEKLSDFWMSQKFRAQNTFAIFAVQRKS